MNIVIKEAIRTVGSQVILAKKLGVSQQVISSWLRDRQKPSPKNARKIEEVTGIPRQWVRPDIFGN
jgi:DNA-binding transcriptional regulator YdaS (Cro superfamily)